MAMQCAHCRGKDMVAGLSYAQCLTCGQLSDFEGKTAQFGPDAETLAAAQAGLIDTAAYAASAVAAPKTKGK